MQYIAKYLRRKILLLVITNISVIHKNTNLRMYNFLNNAGNVSIQKYF